eukprot:CAMPEP_0203787900 /NCGR_PEP_ID=MMETSP0100_2-20121128/2511_1 /ASSEMBLY_ACC=CAM_ASM_000210 /TAXON_ID=96639 /ORGANISM=" , Strain NY0313808BC1" /LENGTH=520 /DNA_ID=CAMNT_0050690509 /DNA_START=343 /DNA_END=1905 /DNA_ORIENTATION=+
MPQQQHWQPPPAAGEVPPPMPNVGNVPEVPNQYGNYIPPVAPAGAYAETPPHVSEPTPATTTKRGKSKEPKGGKDAQRRAAVAAASRATRAKRKRELEELKEKNVVLEKERENFLNTIADLQMKVQALRETGSIDLRMENDLLRAELMEHKNFISRFKRIADGMPTTNTAKKLMCKQGSDTAIAQVLGLLSTSMADPSWKVGQIRGLPEIDLRYQRLPHGVNAANAKRCSMRVDMPVIPCNDPLMVAQIVWKTWCDEDLNKRVCKHFGAVSISVREIETGIDVLSDGESPTPASTKKSKVKSAAKDGKGNGVDESLRNKVKVFYYREETPLDAEQPDGETDTVDTVLLLSTREKSISRSSFPQSERFNRWPPQRYLPSHEDRKQSVLTLEQQQGLHAQKNYDAIVLASTSTQHSLGLVPLKPGVHRIRSALLEGYVFRKVEGGVAMSAVFSYPSSTSGKANQPRQTELVADDGYLNEAWTQVCKEIYAIVREHMPEYVYEEYRKLRDSGVELPNIILDHI